MNFSGLLLEKIKRLEPPAIIAMSGFGGAGKSSLAATLGERIDAPIVGIDSFIIDRTLSGYARWEIMDFDRLEREVLRPFAARQPVRYGHFDWVKNKIGEHRALSSTGRLIVEGVGLFRPALLKYFSLLLWVNCPIHEAIRRGKKRDRENYEKPPDEAWEGIWKENDEECYRDYQPEKIAHFVISNFNPTASPPLHPAASP